MKRTIHAALAAATLLGAAALPQSASANVTLFLINEVRTNTPQCRDWPEYRWVGRVSGFVGHRPPRRVSFVGCFPTADACDAWRGPVSGKITGRIVLNECGVR